MKDIVGKLLGKYFRFFSSKKFFSGGTEFYDLKEKCDYQLRLNKSRYDQMPLL